MSVYEKEFFFAQNQFLNFMALNEVIMENWLHTFKVLYQAKDVTRKFRNFYYFFNFRVNRAGGKT
jgi:hypothetical protein